MTRYNVQEDIFKKLCSLFQVRSSKVDEWLDQGLIRIDLQRKNDEKFPYDIEPLTAQLTAKDIQKWDDFVQRNNDYRAADSRRQSYGHQSKCDSERSYYWVTYEVWDRPGLDWYYDYDPYCRECRRIGNPCGEHIICERE